MPMRRNSCRAPLAAAPVSATQPPSITLALREESMKILDLGEFYSERGGGVRSYLGALLDAAGVRGHEVVVLVPGPRDSDESVPGGRIIRYRAPKMPYDGSYHFPLRVDLMRRYVKMLRPDVLQLSSPYLPWLAASQLRVPVKSYVYHSDPIGA